jgi:hypothetical protein
MHYERGFMRPSSTAMAANQRSLRRADPEEYFLMIASLLLHIAGGK